MISRWYARMLRLYPKPFYTRFADEMQAVFEEAWDDAQRKGNRRAMMFCLREFAGLVQSISQERRHHRGKSLLRSTLRWRFAPVWLFAFSLMAAALVSLSYWGYLVVPGSKFEAIADFDDLYLVRFGDDYFPTAMPLNTAPILVTDSFPPSQILSKMYRQQQVLPIRSSIDNSLAIQIQAALNAEHIDLGFRRPEPPSYPVFPEDCDRCFQMGIQPQPDGSLLQLLPLFDEQGQPTGEVETFRVTPDDWWYYNYVVPSGYAVRGTDAHGVPLLFLAISSGAIGNDRYLYNELLYEETADGLRLRDRQTYWYDVAGMEGFTFPVIAGMLFAALLVFWLGLSAIRILIGIVSRPISRRRIAERI